MNKKLQWAVAMLAVGALLPAHGQAGTKLKELWIPILTTDVTIKVIPGLTLNCPKRDALCEIPVKVRPASTGPGCVASVDYEAVNVRKKGTKVYFVLNRGNTDAAVYEFFDEGVVFPARLNPHKVPKDSLKFVELYPAMNPGVARWESLKKKEKELQYEPVVRRVSPDPINCEAIDPMINNDGG